MGIGTSCEIRDGIATIGIDDGKVNAMSLPLMSEIDQALAAAEEAGALVVLRGRQGIFSAGFDLPSLAQGPDMVVEMLRAGAGLVLRLLEFPRPVLTVCTGHAYPMGAFLLLASDVRFALAGDWRIGLNEVAIGITVPEFALELARHRLTPYGVARVATAGMFSPEQAEPLGYVDRVVRAGALEEAVELEAERLRALDAPSFAETKSRIHREACSRIRAALESEHRRFLEARDESTTTVRPDLQ